MISTSMSRVTLGRSRSRHLLGASPSGDALSLVEEGPNSVATRLSCTTAIIDVGEQAGLVLTERTLDSDN